MSKIRARPTPSAINAVNAIGSALLVPVGGIAPPAAAIVVVVVAAPAPEAMVVVVVVVVVVSTGAGRLTSTVAVAWSVTSQGCAIAKINPADGPHSCAPSGPVGLPWTVTTLVVVSLTVVVHVKVHVSSRASSKMLLIVSSRPSRSSSPET